MKKKNFAKQLRVYINKVKHWHNLMRFSSEENSKVKFVIWLFDILDWNKFSNEMEFEYPVGKKNHVDIALYKEGSNKPCVLVEIKSLRGKLGEGRQLLEYLRKTGTRLGIYTNGKELKLVSMFKVRAGYRPQVLIHFEAPEYFSKYSGVLYMLSKKRVSLLEEFAEAFHSGEYSDWKKKQKSKISSRNLRHLEFARDFLKHKL